MQVEKLYIDAQRDERKRRHKRHKEIQNYKTKENPPSPVPSVLPSLKSLLMSVVMPPVAGSRDAGPLVKVSEGRPLASRLLPEAASADSARRDARR